MKKYTFATLLLLVALSCFAKQKSDHKRWETGNINLGVVSTSFTQGDSPKLKSNYGVSFNVGRTFYVHKKPIANMLRFGNTKTKSVLVPPTEADNSAKKETLKNSDIQLYLKFNL